MQALAQALQQTGLIGGGPKLVHTAAVLTHGNNVTISGLTPGRLLLWMVIANQSDGWRQVSYVSITAASYSSVSGLLVGHGLKPNTSGRYEMIPISRIGYRDQGSNDVGGIQNMDMAIITGTTVNLHLDATGDDYPQVNFYQL